MTNRLPSPMPQVLITSDRLRQMARELINQANALDALVEYPRKKRAEVKLIDPRGPKGPKKCAGS